MVGVERRHTVIHNWGQNADRQPSSHASTNHTAVDETVIRVNDERHCLDAAVILATNEIRQLGLFQARTIHLTLLFLRELRDQQQVTQATFLGDETAHLASALSRLGFDFRQVATEIGPVLDMSLVR